MNIDVEKLLKEAKIIYWKENEYFHENHIGKQDKNKDLDNSHEYSVLQSAQEG